MNRLQQSAVQFSMAQINGHHDSKSEAKIKSMFETGYV